MKNRPYNTNDLVAGALSGLVIVIIATAFTALVFKGPLVPYFSIGITCALVGSCIVNLLTACLSSFRFGIARVEPASGAILAIIFANIASYNLPSATLLPTLLVTLSLVTLMVGGSMFLLGYFRLGQIARFLPFPVLGGIITGTAWIMAYASFSLMINNNFTLSNLTQSHVMMQYLTGVGFALLLFFILKKNARSWLLPATILIASLLVNLLLRFNHVSHLDAIQQGWLFLSFKPTFFLQSVNLTMLQQIDWSVIAYQLHYLLSLVGVIIILLLLNVSGLEAAVKDNANLDQELKVAGIGNLLSTLVVGAAANLSFSGTILNQNSGAKHRVSGVVASLVCLFVLFFYPEIISYLPIPIIGGLLLFISFKLLTEWLYDGWKKLPLIDYLIVISILITVAVWGFLPGVLIGIIITCIVFIIHYARIDVIKFATTGENYHSNVIRPPYQQKWQVEKGNGIKIFKLQGFLFFGSAKLLLDKVATLIESDNKQELSFIIFDFQLVNGVDSSAIYHFIRLQQLLDRSSLQIIFTGCSKKLIAQFKQQGVIDITSRVTLFHDLDQGLEWCEDKLLESMPKNLQQSDASIENTLSLLIPDKNQRDIFEGYLEKIEIPTNTILFKQDDIVDCLYFIESGQVAVFIEKDQSIVRVSKSGAGTIVGEIGFYLHTPRTATVRTESTCVVYKLTENSMLKLEKSTPDIALTFHKSIINVLALRVIQTNYELMLVSQ